MTVGLIEYPGCLEAIPARIICRIFLCHRIPVASRLINCPAVEIALLQTQNGLNRSNLEFTSVFRSPAGQKYLRRMRFSKRRFTEQQAEQWWAQHRSTLQQQYGILTGDSIAPSRTSHEKG